MGGLRRRNSRWSSRSSLDQQQGGGRTPGCTTRTAFGQGPTTSPRPPLPDSAFPPAGVAGGTELSVNTDQLQTIAAQDARGPGPSLQATLQTLKQQAGSWAS